MSEKLKLFGTRTKIGNSLYNMQGVKKTFIFNEKAKLGTLPKQSREPIRSSDGKNELETPAIPQWLVDLKKRKEIQPMATKPANHRK